MDWDLFGEECEVNQYELEKNSQYQANLRVKYMSRYPDLVEKMKTIKLELGALKKELKSFDSVLSLNIRRNPDMFGITGKATEGSIDAVILSHADRNVFLNKIYTMEMDLINTEKFIDELEVVKASLDDRKDSINVLAKLYINAYYADNPLEQLNEKCNRMKKE